MKKFRNLLSVFYILISLVLIYWLFSLAVPSDKEQTDFTANIKGEVFVLEIASEPKQWEQGLSGRQSLADNEGLLFIFPDHAYRSFWMKNMYFAIDILWLKDNQIVDFAKNISVPEPDTLDQDLERYVSPLPVNLVLEVVAGTIDRLNIEKGDIIEFDEILFNI